MIWRRRRRDLLHHPTPAHLQSFLERAKRVYDVGMGSLAADWLTEFAAHLPDPSVFERISQESLAQELHTLHKRGQAAWPGVELPLREFAAHVAGHCTEEALAPTLSAILAEDLYLAAACTHGVPAALRAFDESFLSRLPLFLSRLKPTPTFVDEIGQVLREKLLVAAAGKRAKISEYSGRGSLLGWLRVTAMRTAVSARRNLDDRLPGDGDELQVEALAAGGNVELDYLRERYKKEFQLAFHSALGKLTAEQRNLLRLHFLDGLNIEKIGAVMHVHRATVARWISAAREEILDNVKRDLNQRLRLEPSEFDSLVNLVRSQLQVSILRYLKESPP
jgi:RNA polymerase sigma-70 factor (ECF subfamily)